MHLVWRKSGARDFVIEKDGEEAGRLKIHGATGATAQFGANAYSFRVAGLDPVAVAPWKRRFTHDCTIMDLGSGANAASYVVKPFNRTLRVSGGRAYQWSVSFLMRRVRWTFERRTAVEFRLRGHHNSGDIVVDDEAENVPLLVLFGLYLAKSGR